MRISNQAIVRNYTNNLNKNLSSLNYYSNMVTTQRRFTSMSESTSSGVRAMQIRRTMSHIEAYSDTASTMKSQLKAAEDQLMQASALATEIAYRYTGALSENNGPDERAAMRGEIVKLRDQILSSMNAQFAGRYQFGGTNTGSAPFTLDTDPVTGKELLLYNGINVADMADASGNLKPEYQYLMNDAAFVDIGIGLRQDGNGVLIESSAFKSTMTGIEMFGFGDKNIYLVCNEIIDALDDPNFSNVAFQELLTKMQDAGKAVTLNVTEIGAQYNYLEFVVGDFENQTLNLAERQNYLEFIDPAEAIMQWKMQEYVYNAALQMGQRLLQPTLFNFIS